MSSQKQASKSSKTTPMQKILIEITTSNNAKPEAVAETLSQMTGRKCRLVTPPSTEELDVNAKGRAYNGKPLTPREEKIFLSGAQFTKDWML